MKFTDGEHEHLDRGRWQPLENVLDIQITAFMREVFKDLLVDHL